MEFKDRLKKLRQERNISQQGLADSIYVSRSAVAKWENGLGIPNKTSYEALLEYFNITENELPLNEEMETVSVSKNHKIRKLSKIVIVLSLAFICTFAVLITSISLMLYQNKDKMRIEDINDEYFREIWRGSDYPGKLTGIMYSASGITIEELVEIFYIEGYAQRCPSQLTFPTNGKFVTADGEVFKSRVGICGIIDYGRDVKYNFNVRIFDRYGYLITEKAVTITCSINDEISTSNIGSLEKYWIYIQASPKEFINN